MKRYILDNLKQWKTDPHRKPMVLMGAPQVGKTWVLREFGTLEYENLVYLNLETSPHLHALFAGSLAPANILQAISIELSADIAPQKTLIIFDEIQECPAALNSLKYFNEFANEYHVCAAGSLLGVTLANTRGFPVGKVDFMHLYPLCLPEFLEATGENRLLQFLEDIDETEPLPENLHEKLLQYFREYLYTGGMPSAVLAYAENRDFDRIRQIQKNILNAYRLDFAKHAPASTIMKINQVWDIIPAQLAKENHKFIYSVIRKGARAQEFEAAIQWLQEAGLIYKTHMISTPKLPVSAYVDHATFKIYLMDVGLLGAMSGLPAKTMMHGNEIFQEFHGALSENYVAQELVHQGYALFYWTSGGQAELDFILQHEESIYPLEVKSGVSSKKKSLITYIQKYNPDLAARILPMNLKQNGKILNCPLYLAGMLRKFLTNAIPQNRKA